MSELKEIYWTSFGFKKSPKMGIISLTNNGITIYKKKGLFGKNIREIKYLELNFKDITYFTLNILALQKEIIILLTDEKFTEIINKQNILLRFISKILNPEKRFCFSCGLDSKSEVMAFIEKYNQLSNSKKINYK